MNLKRKQKLIKPGLQMRLIVVFACVACTSVLVQAIMLNRTLLEVFDRLPNDRELLLGEWPEIMLTNVLITFAFVVPITLGIGILATFKIAGPIFRFEQHFKELIAGRNPGPCVLRKDDELKAFADLMNRAFDAAREQAQQEAQETPSHAVAAASDELDRAA